MKRVVSFLLIVLCLCGASASVRAQFVVDFTETASKTIDAVVHIKCDITKLTPMYQSFFGMIINQGVQRQTYTAYGSGVIISADGYIITNNHVVQDASTIKVTLNDKRVLSATLVGNDPATDLAVIKVEATVPLKALNFGNSEKVRIGEPVLAIGNPFNLTSTVTAGIISAKARNMDIIKNPTGESTIESFLQTDAAVNSGNSGGALVNVKGELIGINTAIASGNGYYTGYSFAIPSNIARKVSNDLMKYQAVQRGYLGVNVAEVDEDLAKKKGLSEVKGIYVGRVIPDCAAERAGLKVGDIILKVNHVAINSYAEMMEEVGYFYPGDNVDVEYLRDGKVYTAPLQLLNSQGNTDIVRPSND